MANPVQSITVTQLVNRNPPVVAQNNMMVTYFLAGHDYPNANTPDGSIMFLFNLDAQGNRQVTQIHFLDMMMVGFEIPLALNNGMNAFNTFENAWQGGDNARNNFSFTFQLAPPPPPPAAPAAPPAGAAGAAPAARKQKGGKRKAQKTKRSQRKRKQTRKHK